MWFCSYSFVDANVISLGGVFVLFARCMFCILSLIMYHNGSTITTTTIRIRIDIELVII